MKKLMALMALAAAVTAGAQKIPLDNRFMPCADDCSVRGWKYNQVKTEMPFGPVKPLMRNGVAGVSLTSTGRSMTIVLREYVDVKPGERYRMSALVSGKGQFAFRVFQNAVPWKWMGTQGDYRAATVEERRFEQDVTVPEGVGRIGPALSVAKDSDVRIFDFALEQLP